MMQGDGSYELTPFLKTLEGIKKERRNDASNRSLIEKEILNLDDQRIRIVLGKTADADSSCSSLYEQLNQRVESLACEIIDEVTGKPKRAIVSVYYPWRVRVGGLQGFRERLLPAMHPIYGIPYVPAASIKGILRAWATKNNKDEVDINNLLGFLDGEKASLAAVEILDAFPTAPSLSLDVATPQWQWQGDEVKYAPSPHQILSLHDFTINIGLTYTSRGKQEDVQVVMGWLEQAMLDSGLGSRVSAGYGLASQVNSVIKTKEPSSLQSEHGFELWSQGIYSISDQIELRSVAIRGVLRYWFRAIALSFCSPQECKVFEAALFGSLDASLNANKKPTQGSIRVSVDLEEISNQDNNSPYYAKGRIHLESTNRGHLTLIKYILKLAMHLGGIGRGARRPLHWNSGRLRGCYWQPTSPGESLGYSLDDWQKMLGNLQDICRGICKELSLSSPPKACSPGDTEHRYQDVLNKSARIFLIKADNMRHPKNISGDQWPNQSKNSDVLGPGLDFWYESGFKGVNRNKEGNSRVGGKLGIPSFVWIQSNNLSNPNNAYQVITLFAADHTERKKFLKALESSSQLREKIEVPLPWV
jgi:CRISPR-associated protein Cmr6